MDYIVRPGETNNLSPPPTVFLEHRCFPLGLDSPRLALYFFRDSHVHYAYIDIHHSDADALADVYHEMLYMG